MSKWADIETDFGDDETVNFGKRAEFASSDSLYHLQTLATLRKSSSGTDADAINNDVVADKECGENIPLFVSASNGEEIAVGVGCDLSIFSFDAVNCSASLNLGNSIDGLCWLPSTSILVYVSRSSHFGFIEAKTGKLLFKKQLPVKSDWHGIRFLESVLDESGYCSLFCLPDRGPIIVVRLHYLSSWLDALVQKNMAILKKLVGMISVHSVDVGKKNFGTAGLTTSMFFSGLMLLESESQLASFCHCEGSNAPVIEELIDIDSGYPPVKMEVAASGRYMIMLDSCGEIAVWDAITMIRIGTVQSDGRIEDFMVLEMRKGSHSLDNNRLLIFRREETEKIGRLEIRSLPECSVIYSVSVSAATQLVKSPHGQNDEGSVAVLECVMLEDNVGVDCLRLRQIRETQPETRLTRLLSKAMFQEAKSFALQFGLNVQLVYTTEVNYLVGKLQVTEDSESCMMLFGALKECIGNILDPMVVAVTCLSCVSLPRAEWILCLLCLGETRLNEVSEMGEKAECLMTDILQTKRRLKTYQLVKGRNAELGHPTEWTDYMKGRNLVDMMIGLIEAAGIQEAVIFWAREETALRKELAERGSWSALMNSLVKSVVEGKIVKQIENVRNFLEELLVHAAFLDDPVKNMEAVAKSLLTLCHWLELGDPENWPANALGFAEIPEKVAKKWFQSGDPCCAVTPSQKSTAASAHCVLDCYSRDENSSCFSLRELLGKLRELERLHRVFNCGLSLSQFLKETKETICYRILDRVQAIELLPISIEKFARQYMKEKLLNEDETLYRYVLDIAEHASLASSSGGILGEAPWENRALVVIKAIQSLDFYAQSVLAVAKHAKIPWSPSVSELIETALKLNNQTLKFELENQKCLAGLRNILNKYLIRGQQLRSSLHSRGRFFKLLCSILNADPSDGVVMDLSEAARMSQLLSENDIFVQHLINLSKQRRLSDVLNLLENLSPSAQMEVGKKLLLRIRILLDSAPDFHAEHSDTFLTVYARIVKKSLYPVEKIEYEKLVCSIRNARKLEKESGHTLQLSVIHCGELDLAKIPFSDKMNGEKVLLKLASLTHVGILLSVAKLALKKKSDITLKCLRMFCDEVSHWRKEEISEMFQLLCSSVVSVCRRDCSPSEFQRALISTLRCLPFIMRSAETSYWLPALKLSTFCRFLLKILGQSDPSSKMETDSVASSKDRVFGLTRYAGIFKTENDGLFIDGRKATAVLRGILDQFISFLRGDMERDKEMDWTKLNDVLASHDQRLLIIQGALFRLSYLGGTPAEVAFLQKHAEKAIERLISKCTATNQDYWLGLGLFSFLPEKQNFKVLLAIKNSLVSKQNRALATLIGIGRAMAALNGDAALFQSSKDPCTLAKWAVKLGKYNIPLDTVSAGYKERLESVRSFLENGVPIKFLWAFCEDFGLDITEAALAYVSTAMEKEGNVYQARICLHGLVSSKTNVLKELTGILMEEVDPYNYEVIDFVLGEMELMETTLGGGSEIPIRKLVTLAVFLSAYTRNSEPGTEERSWYNGRYNPSSGSSASEFHLDDMTFVEVCGHGADAEGIKKTMPGGSKRRLPFHLFLPSSVVSGGLEAANPVVVSVLEKEITLRNMNMWQRFAASTSLVKLSENLMMLQAVQNSVMENPDGRSEGTVELGKETMEEVKKVLLFAKDPQVALKCIGWLAKKLPFGTQRLEIVKCGLDVAKQWLTSVKSQGNAEQEKSATQFLCNFEAVWRKLGTELLLREYGLLNKATSALILSPAKLIYHLFETHDSDFLDRSQQVSLVVPKIAQLNSVNLQKIQTFMLDKWLPPLSTQRQADMDETGIGIMTRKSSSETEHFPFARPDISKAVFVLKHWDSRQASYHLLAIINQEGSGYAAKIRALCCLLRLLGPGEIHSMVGLTIQHLRSKLMELLYVDELAKASLPYSTQAFQDSSKESLAKALWRNHTQNHMVLPVVSHLCVDFHVVNCDFLEDILKQLSRSGSDRLFREMLLFCERQKQLWMVPSLSTLWTNHCQSSRVKSSSNMQSDEEISVVCKNLLLTLLRCPKDSEAALRQLIGGFSDSNIHVDLCDNLRLLQ